MATGRLGVDYDPVTQENNAAVQVNNPNVQVAPATVPTPATEPTAPQETSNPANNGIVPQGTQALQSNELNLPTSGGGFGGFSQQASQIGSTKEEINQGLTQMSLNNIPMGGNNKLNDLYGISQASLDEEFIKNKTAPAYYDANGNYIVREIQQYQMTPATSAKAAELDRDFSEKIRISGKVANSGTGIDPSFGTDVDSAVALMRKLSNTDAFTKDSEKNRPLIANINSAADLMERAIQAQNADQYQDAVAKFKIAVGAFAEKAGSQEYAKYGGTTSLIQEINNYTRAISKLESIYQADEKGLNDFYKGAKDSFNKITVTYKKIQDTRSVSAKKELMENPVYQNFLKMYVEKRPYEAEKIRGFMQTSTIGPDEAAFIKDVFVGDYAAGLFEAKKAAQEQLGNIVASQMFEGFDAIFDLKNIGYRTMADDLNKENPIDKLQFNLNTGGGHTSGYSTGYSSGQSGGQSYNTTRQASARSVNRSIG